MILFKINKSMFFYADHLEIGFYGISAWNVI